MTQPPPPLSLRTHHKYRKIRGFLLQKVRTSASEESPPPCPKNVRTDTSLPPPDCGKSRNQEIKSTKMVQFYSKDSSTVVFSWQKDKKGRNKLLAGKIKTFSFGNFKDVICRICTMTVILFVLVLAHSFVCQQCQGTSTRRQQRDLFGLRVKLPSVTTSLTTKR